MACLKAESGAEARVEIRALGPADAAMYQALRLHGMRHAPEAFGSTYEEDAALPLESIASRLDPHGGPAERIVLGAFSGGDLVGMIGCYREHKLKARHKVVIWGMYVLPEYRGSGIGRELLALAVGEARVWPGVERITLSVVRRMAAARALYRSVGFECFGVEPDGLREGETSDMVEYYSMDARR